jgi:hypothetical protein
MIGEDTDPLAAEGFATGREIGYQRGDLFGMIGETEIENGAIEHRFGNGTNRIE